MSCLFILLQSVSYCFSLFSNFLVTNFMPDRWIPAFSLVIVQLTNGGIFGGSFQLSSERLSGLEEDWWGWKNNSNFNIIYIGAWNEPYGSGGYVVKLKPIFKVCMFHWQMYPAQYVSPLWNVWNGNVPVFCSSFILENESHTKLTVNCNKAKS